MSLERMYMSGTPGRGIIMAKLSWRMIAASQQTLSAIENLNIAMSDGYWGSDELLAKGNYQIVVLEQEWQLACNLFSACL